MRRALVNSLIMSVVMAAVAVGLVSCERKQETGPDVLATVNGETITRQDLYLALAALPESEQEQYIGSQGTLKLLDEIVTWRLMTQEAVRRRLDEDPAVKSKLDRFRQQLLVNALLENAVSDAEIFEYYQKNFIRASFIFLPFPENAGDKARAAVMKKGLALHAKLDEGADFEELARNESKAANAARGGDMGYVTHETVTNMIDFKAAEKVFALKEPGDYTASLEGPTGCYIFLLTEQSGNLHPSGLNSDLKGALREIKREEAIRSFANELNTRPENNIVKHEAAIQDLLHDIEQATEPAEGSTVQAGSTADEAPIEEMLEAPVDENE